MECDIFNKEFKHYKNDEGKYFCTECCIYAECCIFPDSETKPNEYKIVTVIGYSICSEKDQFIKKLGRTIAEGRAKKALDQIIKYGPDNVPDKFFIKQHIRNPCFGQPKSVADFYQKYFGHLKVRYRIQTVDEFEYEHSASVAC